MPPKRAASSSTKRKVVSDSEEGESSLPKASSSKKAKIDDSVGPGPNGQPTNKVLPSTIEFPARTPGSLRIAAWNICGLAASQKKGFKYYVEAEDADILVLTETKVNNDPVDPSLASRYPHRYWSIGDKKTYAGTAILCKHEPLSVTKTLPGHPDPKAGAGRIVTLEFEKCYIVGTYVVNAGEKLKNLDLKKAWNVAFEAYIRELDAKKPVIWTGDLNVAPTEIDLANPKRNWNKTPGYTEAETSAFAHVLDPSAPLPCSSSQSSSDKEAADAATPPEYASAGKFVDVWRAHHPNTRHYTYFSYRFNARIKGLGWRLDMFVLSERIANTVKMCEIRSEIWGASDHCPLVMEINTDAVL